ncbi:Transcriptional regulator of nonfermentable carbon utilization [Coniothyrium glycines]
MTTPDADDASPSPEYSGDDLDMAADHADDRHSNHASPDHKNGNGKPNSKDPLRPRRKKARRACFACQRAHLTCGDERPCLRCIKRGLQDHCMDGVRKKAKYLHDAPDGALMPGVGGHYPYMNGNRPTPIPTQDTQPVAVSPHANLFPQAPHSTFYPQNTLSASLPVTQDGRPFNTQQSPMTPPFNQPHNGSVQNAPSSMPQEQPAQMQQFGPIFDPSDPALFNFDISNLNFGNHYGALEFGMLGHMSSGAVDVSHDNAMMGLGTQPANMYGQQHMPTTYSDHSNSTSAMSFAQNALTPGEWQDGQGRQGSMHVQTASNTPTHTNHDHHNHRGDSLNGPHAFAIGQGPGSTASPASTDASAYENDNPLATATFFANAGRQHAQRSPVLNRPQQQENRYQNTALQPIQSNGIRKRQRDTETIYNISKPYDYVKGYHRLYQLINKKYTRPLVAKAQEYLQNYRPVLLHVREELNTSDLIHQEMGLQRSLLTLQEHFAEVGTPFLICRRSGEIVGINKEFTILTGWRREVLLGHEPNLNVNIGTNRKSDDSELSTSNTTPNLQPMEKEGDEGRVSVNIVELMDPKSALEFLQNFSELAYQDPRGYASQRVNMLRYQTKSDVERIQERKDEKPERIKLEGGMHVHQGESAMQRLGAKNGMVDCMIWWHIKRDIFDLPMLVGMSVMPVLDKGLQ